MTMLPPELAPEFWASHTERDANKPTIFADMRAFVAERLSGVTANQVQMTEVPTPVTLPSPEV